MSLTAFPDDPARPVETLSYYEFKASSLRSRVCALSCRFSSSMRDWPSTLPRRCIQNESTSCSSALIPEDSSLGPGTPLNIIESSRINKTAGLAEIATIGHFADGKSCLLIHLRLTMPIVVGTVSLGHQRSGSLRPYCALVQRQIKGRDARHDRWTSSFGVLRLKTRTRARTTRCAAGASDAREADRRACPMRNAAGGTFGTD
jgi:hypothetical protein